MTDQQVRSLRGSSNPEDRRLGATIARARTAYADTIAQGGRVIVTNSASNGGHPVATVVGPDFDPSKPARVHTHYHGWHATVADPKGHSSGTTYRMEQLQKRDPQTVFVLPEARNAPPGGGPVQTDWSNVKDQAQTTRDALRATGIDNVGKRIVSAHSGGGSALARAAGARSDGRGLEADRLELQDSLYGSENALARWARTAPGQEATSVVYLRGTNRVGRDAGLARAFGDRYQRINVAAPRASDVPFVVDSNGNPTGARIYAVGAHNRTVGELMDSVAGP